MYTGNFDTAETRGKERKKKKRKSLMLTKRKRREKEKKRKLRVGWLFRYRYASLRNGDYQLSLSNSFDKLIFVPVVIGDRNQKNKMEWNH